MSEYITPDEAIVEALKVGAQGISLGLAKQLQAERDRLRAEVARREKEVAFWKATEDDTKGLAIYWRELYEQTVVARNAARASALEEAAEEVYRSGWNDNNQSGNLKSHSMALKEILRAKAQELRKGEK